MPLGERLPRTAVQVVLASRRLPAGIKLVWEQDFYLDQGPEGAWISGSNLAKRLGMTKETVEKYRRVLSRLGLHESRPRPGGRTMSWYATLPAQCIPPKGMSIEEVITDAQILGLNEQVIATGVGACARSEIGGGNLNNTIKRACKRARVDAVKRLPTISALFQDDILEELAAAAKRNQNNAARKRTQTVKNPWDTGAILEVCPIGNEIRGKAWREIDTGALDWLVANVTDKPDVTRAATGELSKRVSATDPG